MPFIYRKFLFFQQRDQLNQNLLHHSVLKNYLSLMISQFPLKICLYDYGKFGWILDNDGNKIELWEPKDDAFL